jgi:SAM-dependent methyltransferase
VAEQERVPPGVDPAVPSIARAYDAFLGGKDNFAVDRDLVDATVKVLPEGRGAARANRAFLRRVVRYLVEEVGIEQFIDFGSGLPSQGNVHEVAHAVNPGVRVVYVDIDPMVLAHARALLAGGNTTVITADVRQPDEILDHPKVRELIDFERPLGILLFAILHHINDHEAPGGIAARLREVMVPGSHLAISHFYRPTEHPDEEERVLATEKLFNERLGTGRWRTREEILGFFGDLELVEPGLVQVRDWKPVPDEPDEFPYHWFVGGVARRT